MRHELRIGMMGIVLIACLSGCAVQRDPVLIYEPTFSHLRHTANGDTDYLVSTQSTLAAGLPQKYDLDR